MAKAMTQATGAHNLRVTMAIVATAVLLFALTLFTVVQKARRPARMTPTPW